MYPFWVSVGAILDTAFPNMHVTVSESQGAVAITKRVRSGECEFGNAVSSTDYESYNGMGTFEGDPDPDLRMIWYYEATWEMPVVDAKAGINNITDLDGKKFNPGGTGTAASVVIHAAFDALGIHPDYFAAGQADAADAYANRQIVGAVKTGPSPDSYVMQLNSNRPVRILAISDEDMAKILEAIPSVKSAIVPANSYEGVDYDAQCISTYQGVQVSMDFSQEEGYKFFKAMWEDGKEIWQNAYPVGANNDVPAMTLQAAATPLHAGTVQWLVEHGYEVPEHLIPPEYVPVK